MVFSAFNVTPHRGMHVDNFALQREGLCIMLGIRYEGR